MEIKIEHEGFKANGVLLATMFMPDSAPPHGPRLSVAKLSWALALGAWLFHAVQNECRSPKPGAGKRCRLGSSGDIVATPCNMHFFKDGFPH